MAAQRRIFASGRGPEEVFFSKMVFFSEGTVTPGGAGYGAIFWTDLPCDWEWPKFRPVVILALNGGIVNLWPPPLVSYGRSMEIYCRNAQAQALQGLQVDGHK